MSDTATSNKSQLTEILNAPVISKDALHHSRTSPRSMTFNQSSKGGKAAGLPHDQVSDKIIICVEESDDDSRVIDLTTVSSPKSNEAPLQPHLQAGDKTHTTTSAPPPVKTGWSWAKRTYDDSKKRKSLGASVSSSSRSPPKRPRLFGLDRDTTRIGSVNKPIILPLENEIPQPDVHSALLPFTRKEYEAHGKKKKSQELIYRGVYALLDCVGRPIPFPAKAKRLIKEQQNNHKQNGISPHAYDGSFQDSMANDGKGKIGERSFSSTGANVRFAPVASRTRCKIQIAGDETGPGKKATSGSVVVDSAHVHENVVATTQSNDIQSAVVPESKEIQAVEPIAGDVVATIPEKDFEGATVVAAKQEIPILASVQIDIGTKTLVEGAENDGISKTTQDVLAIGIGDNVPTKMTSTKKVLGSCELLEMILLECDGDQAYETILKAQRVNKTFEKVVKRSMKLRLMLFPNSTTILKLGGVAFV